MFIAIAISGCTESPRRPSPRSPAAARPDATFDAFVGISRSCPHTLSRQGSEFSNSMGEMAHAEVTNDDGAIAMFQARYDVRIAQRGLERRPAVKVRRASV